jgi:DNA-binding transcriptional MerR regulator
MTIDAISERIGVATSALRFYEAEGLISVLPTSITQFSLAACRN